MITSPCGVRGGNPEARQGIKQSTYQPAGIFPHKKTASSLIWVHMKGSYKKGHEGFGFDLENIPMRQQEEALRRSQVTLAGLDQMFADYFMSHTAQEAIDILIDNRIRAAVIKDCGRRDGRYTGRRGGLGHYEGTRRSEKDITAF